MEYQDICETDGFLLHPFHIFSIFLELYDTVFHKPETDQSHNIHKKNTFSRFKQLLLKAGRIKNAGIKAWIMNKTGNFLKPMLRSRKCIKGRVSDSLLFGEMG